jgi:replicative DNA helicase
VIAPDESLDDEILRRARRQEERDRRNHLRLVPDDGLVQIGDTADPWEHDKHRFRLGIENIDYSMHPRRAADFLVVGALPGAGKTSVLEQSAVANARDGNKVLVVSLEMTIPDLDKKMLGREMRVDMHEFERQRELKTDRYLAAKETLNALPLKLYRPPEGSNVNIRRVFEIAERWGAEMIALDYAALLDGWRPGNEARDIVNYCAAKTKDTGIYLMLLAQLKVEAMLRKNFRPTMADFEDTKAFSKAATGVVLLHRPFNGDPRKDTVAEWIIAKNRRLAPSFRGHSHWHGPTTTFYSMSPEEETLAHCCYKPPKKKGEKVASRSTEELAEEDALLDEARTLFSEH